jgi:hypothetical protein
MHRNSLPDRIKSAKDRPSLLRPTLCLQVVFSADLLGNPVAVVSALGTGMRDFFVHPAAGLVRSPAAFGRGLGIGSLSLLGNTVAGVGMGVGSLASTLGRGVALLSFDDDYVRARAGRAALAATLGGPSNIGAGLLAGAKDLGRGLVQVGQGGERTWVDVRWHEYACFTPSFTSPPSPTLPRPYSCNNTFLYLTSPPLPLPRPYSCNYAFL